MHSPPAPQLEVDFLDAEEAESLRVLQPGACDDLRDLGPRRMVADLVHLDRSIGPLRRVGAEADVGQVERALAGGGSALEDDLHHVQ